MLHVAFRFSASRVSSRTVLLAMASIGVVSNCVHAAPLDCQLLRCAPEVLRYCQKKGYKNVGVLKFRVNKGRSAVTDNVGPLNLDVANQLELALVLANRVQQPLGIIRNASAVAATIHGANHLVAEGRPPLFSRRYPLAWGSEEVTPDAFLTGVIFVSDDLRKLAVEIVAFDHQHPMERVVEFDAEVDPFDLIDVGESYLVRGALGDDEQQLAQVVMSANEVRADEQPHPLKDPGAPVGLEIRYDDSTVPIEIREGQAFVREPREGEQVSLVLKRRQPDRARYGLVLKVNGLNTLHKERLPELECHKWVLEPDLNEIRLAGFQLTDDEVEAFKVLSQAASKGREMDYGADVGTISLVVFREGEVSRPLASDLLDDVADDLAVLSRERFPLTTPQNLSVLQAQLREDARRKDAPRGLIAEGKVIEGKTRTVTFTPHPIPMMSVTVTYYRAQ